jgi:hypothetical protein
MAALSTSAPLTRAMPDVSHPATKILDVSGKATEENHVGKGARERERTGARGREREEEGCSQSVGIKKYTKVASKTEKNCKRKYEVDRKTGRHYQQQTEKAKRTTRSTTDRQTEKFMQKNSSGQS